MSAYIQSLLRNGPLPLWDASGLYRDHGKEYFDVEIYSDENYVEHDIDNILNMNTYKCYICDIDVPKTYIIEHIASAKHDACMKIANIALARTQLHMKSDLIQPKRKIEVADTYFCDHCTAVVQTIDKDKHILSNKHLSCVKNDGLLQNLAKIYDAPDKDCGVGNISYVRDIELGNLIQTLDISEENILKLSSDSDGNGVEENASNQDEKGTEDLKRDIKNKLETSTNKHLSCVKNDGLLQNLAKIYDAPDKDCGVGNISYVRDIELGNLIQTLDISEENILKLSSDSDGNGVEENASNQDEKGTEDLKRDIKNKLETSTNKHLSCVKNDGLLQNLAKIYDAPDKDCGVGNISYVRDIELGNLIQTLDISEENILKLSSDSDGNGVEENASNQDEKGTEDLKRDIKNKLETSTNKHLSCVKNDGLLQSLAKIYDAPDKDCGVGNISYVRDIELGNLIQTLDISEENILKLSSDSDGNGVEENASNQDEKGTEDLKRDIKNKLETSNEMAANKMQKPDINDPINNISKIKTKNKANKTKLVASNIDINNTVKENNTVCDNHQHRTKQTTSGHTPHVQNPSGIAELSASNASETEKETTVIASTSKIVKETCEKSEIEKQSKYRESIEDIHYYLEWALLSPTKTIDVTAYSDDAVCISDPKIGNLRVPLENFLGYRVTRQDVVCIVCLDINSANGITHTRNSKHAETIMSPLIDGCYRQLSYSLRHCILCNSVHSTSQIINHTGSKQHTSNEQKYSYTTITTKLAQLAIANCIIWTLNKMYCHICKIQMIKSNDAINQHIQSSSHVSLYTAFLVLNRLEKLQKPGGFYKCTACHKVLRSSYMVAHCNHLRHKKRIGKLE